MLPGDAISPSQGKTDGAANFSPAILAIICMNLRQGPVPSSLAIILLRRSLPRYPKHRPSTFITPGGRVVQVLLRGSKFNGVEEKQNRLMMMMMMMIH
jgi:hypothetical protein